MNNIYDRPATEIRLTEPCFETWISSRGPSFLKYKVSEYMDAENDLSIKLYHRLEIGLESTFNLYTFCRECLRVEENEGSSLEFCEFVLTNNRLPRPEEIEKIILMQALQ